MDAKYIAEKVVSLSMELRKRGLEITPHHSQTAIQALACIEISNRDQIYLALRCTLVNRREHYAIFKEVFAHSWNNGEKNMPNKDFSRSEKPSKLLIDEVKSPPMKAISEGIEKKPQTTQMLGAYSRTEVLGDKDFGELSLQEEELIRKLLKQIEWRPRKWRSRRKGAGRRFDRPDASQTIRESMRYGGEAVKPHGRERKFTSPTIVVLADVSGSMEKYTNMVLYLLHSMHHRGKMRLESFVFGTRLSRITRHLRDRNADSVLRKISAEARDWSGGTRIGEVLHHFNYFWARRVLRGKSIAIVISDGLDRGDIHLLRKELRRLQSNCHRLLWLNPLLGWEDYTPAAAGMLAAMPYIDDFLPIHNLHSLEGLGKVLEQIPWSKTVRRQRPTLNQRALQA